MDEWVWSNGGMILTGENWSTGRKTLYSVGGRWMNVYGTMVEWYWQGRTEVFPVAPVGRHKSPWCFTDHMFFNHSRRCFLFKPTTSSTTMRCGLWMAHLLMLRAITSAVRTRDVLSAFVHDLVRLQQWRSIALVYCTGRSLQQLRHSLTL